MPVLHVTRGLPGSGKSHFARGLAAIQHDAGITTVQIERDSIRMEILDSYWTGKHEDEQKVTKVQHDRILGALKLGMDVISSDTHLPDKSVRSMMDLAHKAGAEVKVHDFRNVDLDLCIERDKSRERTVGEEVIRDKWTRFIKGKDLTKPIDWKPKDAKRSSDFNFEAVENYVAPEDGRETILFDVDGTLAQHEGVRGPYDTSKYREDTLHEDVASILRALYRGGYNIEIMSGRHEDFREDLEFWLDKHSIPHSKITMRERHQISDDIEKLFLFEKHYRNDETVKVVGVFDDRNRVVQNTWRKALGIRCYHVEDGDF